MWWHSEHFQARAGKLAVRQNVVKTVRSFFDERDFFEVDTPCLQKAPGMEAHLQAFETRYHSPDGSVSTQFYLHTSPEFAMKKLLVGGWTRIYQIAHVFRNCEGGTLHIPEFTMLEWYRANADYQDIMHDSIDLLRACARGCGIDYFEHGQSHADPFAAWEIISVCDAFEQYATVNLEHYLGEGTCAAFAAKARELGLHVAADDQWEDIFFRIFLEFIEPELGQGAPAIIHDYPVSMAALARPKRDDPRFAERFEIYVCGMELANAFSELTDPIEQRRRFEAEMQCKHQQYGTTWPVDDDFIAALEYGMPDSGGIALGIDRLVMLATGAEDIRDVLWCAPPGESGR
jgi:lysyl-tRNA synthetase class 2